MQDAELFLSLAEIAGVFVGFGALIAVRSSAAPRPLSGRLPGRDDITAITDSNQAHHGASGRTAIPQTHAGAATSE